MRASDAGLPEAERRDRGAHHRARDRLLGKALAARLLSIEAIVQGRATTASEGSRSAAARTAAITDARQVARQLEIELSKILDELRGFVDSSLGSMITEARWSTEGTD